MASPFGAMLSAEIRVPTGRDDPLRIAVGPSVRSRAATMSGSRCVPASAVMWARTRSSGHASRYGRSWLSASQMSTAAKARAASGICSPLSPRG